MVCKHLVKLEMNESSRGVIRSVAHAHHPIGSVLELVHLFRVFGFFESFVHHVTPPKGQSKGKILNNNNQLFSLLALLPHSVLWKRTILTEIHTFKNCKK